MRLSGTRISAALRLAYLTAIFRQDLTYFDKLSNANSPDDPGSSKLFRSSAPSSKSGKSGTAGSVAVAITTHSNTVQMGISEKIAGFVQGVAMVLSGFAIAFAKNWRLTLVTATILPASVFIYGISIPIDIRMEKAVMEAHAKAAELAEEVLTSVRTAKSFNAEQRLAKRYKELLDVGRKAGVKKAPNSGVQYSSIWFVMYGGYAFPTPY